MSRTIRTFIDSDRLSAELDPVLVLDAPDHPCAHRRGDGTSVEAMRADASQRGARRDARVADRPPRRRGTPSRRTSPRKIAQLKAE